MSTFQSIARRTLIFGLIFLAYLLLWRPVNRWSGKWPSPYWFSTGMGVVLLFLVVRPRLKQLVWVIPYACLAVALSWFLDHGLERMLRDHWQVSGFLLPRWFDVLNGLLARPLVFVALLLLVLPWRRVPSPERLALGLACFAGVFLVLHLFAGMVCTIQIPTHFWGSIDRDAFGFRLGAYLLITVFASALSSVLVLGIDSPQEHLASVEEKRKRRA